MVERQIDVIVAHETDMLGVQQFYSLVMYGGTAVAPTDFVVLARNGAQIVGVGRLCLEQDLLWLRGMQVAPDFQGRGIGTRILRRLGEEIGSRFCCCLPHNHLVEFYKRAGFTVATGLLPEALSGGLSAYSARGLNVVAMIRHSGGGA